MENRPGENLENRTGTPDARRALSEDVRHDAPESPEKKGKKKKSVGREILEWVACIAVAVAIALPIRAYVFEPILVDGRSMAETLQHGERLFVTKFDYLLGDPERFDIIICHYPDRTENFVKRIVGLPGDTVAMRDGTLYVNGEAQDEPYVTHRADYSMEPYTVPEGCYFVLGDNRSNSNDSHLIGPITREQVVGHVRCVFFPLDAIRSVE